MEHSDLAELRRLGGFNTDLNFNQLKRIKGGTELRDVFVKFQGAEHRTICSLDSQVVLSGAEHRTRKLFRLIIGYRIVAE